MRSRNAIWASSRLTVGEHARGRHLRFDRPGRGRHLGEFANDQRFETSRSEKLLGLRIERGEVETDEDVGLAVVDLQLQRRQRVQGRVVDDRPARFQHAEKGDDVMRRVGQVEADMNARLDAELLEARRGAVRERVQFRVGCALAHEVERRLRAEALGGVLEHALHGREIERRVPAHVRRIGLHPRLNGHRLILAFPHGSLVRRAAGDAFKLSWRVRGEPSSTAGKRSLRAGAEGRRIGLKPAARARWRAISREGTQRWRTEASALYARWSASGPATAKRSPAASPRTATPLR